MNGATELEHRYGPRVHVLDNAVLLTALARLGSPAVRRTELLAQLRLVYTGLLLHALGAELPRVHDAVPTRMAAKLPQAGVYRGPVVEPGQEVVVVDVIRAGIVPSEVCFDLLTQVLPDDRVRQDHLHLSRVADAAGHVAGVDLSGSKIGGSVEGALLVLPDPMGATGSTTLRVLEHYRERYGRPARVLCAPMIATPEYLRAVLAADPELVVYTARLDRGLSPPDVLAAVPGLHWDRERGLDDSGYIVPGAGGVGEVVNNAWC